MSKPTPPLTGQGSLGGRGAWYTWRIRPTESPTLGPMTVVLWRSVGSTGCEGATDVMIWRVRVARVAARSAAGSARLAARQALREMARWATKRAEKMKEPAR